MSKGVIVVLFILMFVGIRIVQDWETFPLRPEVIKQKERLAENLLKNAINCKTVAEGIEVFGCPTTELRWPEEWVIKAWIVNNNSFPVRIKKYQREYRSVQYLKLLNPGQVNYDIVNRWTSYSVYNLNGAEIAYIRPYGMDGKTIDTSKREYLDQAYGKYRIISN